MAKHNLNYIYKIHSSRFKNANWNLELSIQEARINEELISLADSQALRFIRQICGIDYMASMKSVKENRIQIKKIKKETVTKENKERVSTLYDELYSILFMKDIVSIVMDTISDFDRLNSKKGFTINGVKFKRLLATPGGVKNSTVVYVSEEIYKELTRRIENGRDTSVELIPAKFESYKALVCSTSTPVPDPQGVLVVNDCKVKITDDVILINDEDITKWPVIDPIEDYQLTNNNSDGYGLICPELAEEWAKALGLKYIPSGFCVRNSFCKGMLYTFDYHEWARDPKTDDDVTAKTDDVNDIWNLPQKVSQTQIILTASMLKLWSSYKSIEHYIDCCKQNGYIFSVTKAAPEKLENERDLNYQFIQSIDLSDADIDELIEPTVSEIKDVLGGDYRKTLLFLKGVHLDDTSYEKSEYDFAKALMIDKRMINDPFVRSHVHKMIKKRIQGAKIGDLRVRGNFSLLSGDPVALLQSMFNMKVTGLLQKGQFYSNYWNERGVDKVAAFRAPMSCHSNIRVLRFEQTEEMKHWYQYMKTVTILNCWDTTASALNGADFDGDSCLTTDNAVLLRNIRELAPIICIQKSAESKVVSESDLIQANKNSFGNAVGTITNRVTSMFDVKASFEMGSEEYRNIHNRILCGQNYQQNEIDKTKGCKTEDMPKQWYDYRSNRILDEDNEDVRKDKEFNLKILADKKPYFFIYRYPALMKQYTEFNKQANQNCLNRFGCTVDALKSKHNKNESEMEFLKYYDIKTPVYKSSSVMNRICWRIEQEFSSNSNKACPFDYKMLMSDSGYSNSRFKDVKELYTEYKKEAQFYMMSKKNSNKKDDDEDVLPESIFVQEAYKVCNNAEELCNIVIELCYQNSNSKQFAWDIAGETIIDNLLKANNNMVSYPVLDPNGDIEFKGECFSMQSTIIREDIEKV